VDLASDDSGALTTTDPQFGHAKRGRAASHRLAEHEIRNSVIVYVELKSTAAERDICRSKDNLCAGSRGKGYGPSPGHGVGEQTLFELSRQIPQSHCVF
jgi:hypothetical protein